MQKRKLGQTDILVSPIGLGTVKIGRTQGVKYPQRFDLPDDQAVLNLFNHAKDWGINLIDTAPAYGLSEQRIGQLLPGLRQDWVICSKAGEAFINGQSHFDFSSAAIIQSVEGSLKHLKTDYLDILLIHSNGQDKKIIEQDAVFETLASLKQAGKIRAFGMSSKTLEGGLLSVELADLAMVTFNTEYTNEKPVLDQALKQNKGILIKKALASGHAKLSAKQSAEFILKHAGVSSIIVGTINPQHLQEWLI